VTIAKVAYNTEGRRLPPAPLDDDDSFSMVADRSSTAERRPVRLDTARQSGRGWAHLDIEADRRHSSDRCENGLDWPFTRKLREKKSTAPAVGEVMVPGRQ
jgi:hypothetical protein